MPSAGAEMLPIYNEHIQISDMNASIYKKHGYLKII